MVYSGSRVRCQPLSTMILASFLTYQDRSRSITPDTIQDMGTATIIDGLLRQQGEVPTIINYENEELLKVR